MIYFIYSTSFSYLFS